jgi:hypothetical protein
MNNEPFVTAAVAAEYLGIRRRFLLEKARQGMQGAYPIGTGQIRQRWVFKLSELAEAMVRNCRWNRKPPQSAPPSYDLVIRRSPLK